MRKIAEIDNSPENFKQLFTIHQEYTFEENLERLVESTNNIVAQGCKFTPTKDQLKYILSASSRTESFLNSKYYQILNSELQERVYQVKDAIAVAAFIENVNIRGNIIEYLITSNGDSTRDILIDALISGKPLPYIKNSNNLGDYNVDYGFFDTKTDIKRKFCF